MSAAHLSKLAWRKHNSDTQKFASYTDLYIEIDKEKTKNKYLYRSNTVGVLQDTLTT